MQITITQEEIEQAISDYMEQRIKHFEKADIALKYNNGKKTFIANIEVYINDKSPYEINQVFGIDTGNAESFDNMAKLNEEYDKMHMSDDEADLKMIEKAIENDEDIPWEAHAESCCDEIEEEEEEDPFKIG